MANGDNNVPAVENPAGPVVEQGQQNELVDPAQPPAKRARFELGDIPVNLAEYIHRYLKLHISDEEIKDNVILEHPVPSNIKEVPELDSYLKVIFQRENGS